jgi:hypothetical protein
MLLLTRIRASIALLVLMSHSPLAVAFEHAHAAGLPQVGHLGITLFVGRRTRVAASELFDLTKPAISRCPSRSVRRTIAVWAKVPVKSSGRFHLEPPRPRRPHSSYM